jgi:segregation and condensation protein B
MDFLQNHIESLVFCSTDPIKVEEIKQCLNEMFEADIPEEDILNALENLIKKYEEDTYPFQILRTAGGFQFLTKPAYQSSISILLKQKSKKRLSTSSLETLAIIAYKQPITKGHIEQIRGVNCDYAVQRLLEKQLIEIQGKSEGVGKPILYGTTEKFMDYFGINSLKDLPLPKDFGTSENQIGDTGDSEHSISGNEPRIQDYQNDEKASHDDFKHTINPSSESTETDQNPPAEDQPDNE